MPDVGYPGGRVPVSSDAIGQVSDQFLTFGTPAQVTVGAAAGNLVAADATAVGRNVYVYVPRAATAGIYVNANGTATSSHQIIEPGNGLTFATRQAISAIRAGGSDVTAHVMAAQV
jgi:hypothetical protein